MGQFDKQPDALGSATIPPRLERVVEGAHRTIDKLAERAAPTVQHVQERAMRVRETGDEWVEDLRSTVRDRPLTSLITAAMFGMVVGRLMR